MTNDEVKQLQIGDAVEFLGNRSTIFTGRVVANNAATIFGTPVVSVKSNVYNFDKWTGWRGIPVPTLFNLKPKKIIRKV